MVTPHCLSFYLLFKLNQNLSVPIRIPRKKNLNQVSPGTVRDIVTGVVVSGVDTLKVVYLKRLPVAIRHLQAS